MLNCKVQEESEGRENKENVKKGLRMFGNNKNLDSICYRVWVFQKQIRFYLTFSNFISKSQNIQTSFSTLFS
jgi:hypothetical protein